MNRLAFILVILLAIPGAGCKRGITAKGSGDSVSDPLSSGGSSDGGPRTRTALVIGNSRYTQLQRLDACKNDAETMAATFQKIGIALHGGKPLFDLTSDQMDAAISGFARSLGRDSEAFLYYTGHGAQIGGSNYLLPVNYDAKYENQARRQAVSLDAILDTLEKTDSRLRVVILDACRDPGNLLPGEPLTKSGLRSKGFDEQRVDAPETLVCFATKHGSVSLADDNASFYSRVLAEEMVKPVRIDDVLRVVARRVYAATDKRQLPFTYGSLLQDHFFAQPISAPAPRLAIASTPTPAIASVPGATPAPKPPAPATGKASAPQDAAGYLQAAQDLVDELKEDERPEFLAGLVVCRLKLKDESWRTALQRAEQAAARLSDEKKTHLKVKLAVQLAADGKMAEATRLIESIADQKERTRAYYILVRGHAALGDMASARSVLEKIPTEERWLVIGDMAEEQAKLGDVAGAEATLREIDGYKRDLKTLPVIKALIKKGKAADAARLVSGIADKAFAAEASLLVATAQFKANGQAAFRVAVGKAETVAAATKSNDLWTAIAVAHIKVGDIPAADAVAKKLEEIHAAKSAWSLMATAALAESNFPAALRFAERAGTPELVLTVQSKAGNFAAALQAADGMAEFRAEACGMIAGYQARMGKVADANATLERLSTKEDRCKAYFVAYAAWTGIIDE